MVVTYKKINHNTWILEVQENGSTKELYIEFPPDALDQVGWDIGDTLEWDIEDGVVSVKKKEQPTEEYPVDDTLTKGTRMDDNWYYFKKDEKK